MNKIKPKILVFTVASWNSKVGSNTWADLLKQYDAEQLANIFIRDELPDSKICSRYFSISENKILKSLFNKRIKTGKEIIRGIVTEQTNDLNEHNKRYERHRKKRRYIMLMFRELVWKFGNWKSKELNDFLDDFQPNIILYSMEGYIHFNRIVQYAIKRTGARAIGYIWDDNFTYKQSKKIGYKIYRYFQRKSLKKLAKQTDDFFAITAKTKREADKFFKINSKVLPKPLNCVPRVEAYERPNYPIRMLYTGKLLIGRNNTLIKIVEVLKSLNIKGKIFLDIYTQTMLKKRELEKLDVEYCRIHHAISQKEVIQKQKQADVLLFLEALKGENSRTARLSFSTKITDYLSSGKCIFAVGNNGLAPIDYLKAQQAALVATNEIEIEKCLKELLSDLSVLRKYAKNAIRCGIENHNEEIILRKFDEAIQNVR